MEKTPLPTLNNGARLVTARSAIGIVHYGLGPIGLAVARLAVQRSNLRSVVAVDREPTLIGRNLASLIGASIPDLPTVQPTFIPDKRSQVALHCTGSRLKAVAPQLLECVAAGLNVVSSCEELAYPWVEDPITAEKIDAAAREQGVTVLGTGINPGYAMDYLPLVLTAVSARVDHIRVRRLQDAGSRRLPLQRKIGVGLTRDQFDERVATGTLGHVGLRQSAQSLAAAYGWTLGALDEVIKPVCADRLVHSALGDIPPGNVIGLSQHLRASADGHEVLDLDLCMAVELGGSVDEIEIDGEPPLYLSVPTGLHGDSATAAIMINVLPSVRKARPGLITMSELPPPHPSGRHSN